VPMNTDTYTILWGTATPESELDPASSTSPASRPIRRKGWWRRTWKALQRAVSLRRGEARQSDPHASRMALLTERVLTSPGALEPHVREALAAGRGVPPGLADYVRKVSLAAHTITAEDIEALKRAGYTEDQIFEATVSVALGAGLKRLRAGLDALWGV
jgi:hypothetical protein